MTIIEEKFYTTDSLSFVESFLMIVRTLLRAMLVSV